MSGSSAEETGHYYFHKSLNNSTCLSLKTLPQALVISNGRIVWCYP